MDSHQRKILPTASVLLSMALAALSCSIYLGGPEPPGPEITPEGDQASIEKAWKDAAALTGDGSITVVFTEAQLTAYLQERLAANPSNTFHSAQVFLRDGQIKIYGILMAANTSASAILILRPEVDEQGEITLLLEQAQVGPLDLPTGLLSAVSDVLTEAFTGSIGSLATGIQVKEVLVGDGHIAIHAVLR